MQCCYPFQDPNLPLEDRVEDLISRLTLDEKISLIPTRQAAVPRLGISEYSVGGEAAHGIAWVGEATVFPQPIGLACTWDKALLQKIGSAIGDEARGYYKKRGKKGGLTLWAPTVDMERDPRWGRTEEAYGEDPCLTGQLTTALIKGMQGSHPFYLKMAATLKHFFANNNEDGRCVFSASIDPRNMREYYWNAFKPSIVNAHTCCIMTAYNAINGVPCIVNPIVENVVKKQWGLSGFVVSDAADFRQTVESHHYFSTYAQTAAAALKSGVDCLTDDPELIKEALKEALDQGLLCEEDIDKALKNIFRIRFRLGQFDPDELNPYSKLSEDEICSPDHAVLAQQAAKESIVLLRNRHKLLPLMEDKLNRVAVIGPLADVVYTDWYSGTLPYKITPLDAIKSRLPDKVICFAEGCDRIVIKSAATGKYLRVSDKITGEMSADGTAIDDSVIFDITDWGWGNFTLRSGYNRKYVNAQGALAASKDEIRSWFIDEALNFIDLGDGTYNIRLWDGKYVSVSGDALAAVDEPDINAAFEIEVIEDGLKKAEDIAASCDAAIVFVGNNPYINGKEDHDRPDIVLAPAQERLLKAVYKVNPKTIMFIIASYPIAVNWADENIPAILYSSHGGQELGNAVASVLFGDYNPAGRLNMTWYKSVDQLPPITDYDIIKGKRTYMYFDGEPLYPFGHGLSYTEFEYSDLRLSADKVECGQSAVISTCIKNIGYMAGDEVVQLYVSARHSRVKRPIKELKAFERIHLEPGQSQTVTFVLPVDDLAFWDVTRGKFCVEAGSYDIMVGNSSADIRLKAVLGVKGEVIPPRDLTAMTKAENYDDYSGVWLDECSEGGNCVSSAVNGSWISFKDVDLRNDISGFEARLANDSDSGGAIEIRLDQPDGPVIGTCFVPCADERPTWVTATGRIAEVDGIRDVYIRFKGRLALAWFRLTR